MIGRVQRFSAREPWLAARKIGGSDVAKILTRDGQPISPYGGPRSVQRRLLGEPMLEESADPGRARGTRWEPVVITAAVVETGRRIRRVRPFTLYDGPEPWSTVSPDAWIEESPGSTTWGVAELKTDMSRFPWAPSCTMPTWDVGLALGIREDYAWQTMYEAWALDKPFAELIVLLPHYDVRCYRFLRDERREAKMARILRGFWNRHIEERQPLPPDDVDRERYLLERTYSPEARSYRPATPREMDLVGTMMVSDRTLEGARAWRDRCETELLFSIGRARGLKLPNGRRATVVRAEGKRPYILLSGGPT